MYNYSTIEQSINQHERVLTHTVGVSMEPLLHDRKSTVVLEKCNMPLKRYDVVLYHRPTGEYVLHRVIGAIDNSMYVIRGDNCIANEIVPAEWIIGIMTGYYADEKNIYVSCESKRYQRYLKTLGWRHKFLELSALSKRVRRKLRSLLIQSGVTGSLF